MMPTDIRLCFLGDSYVQGTGDDACLGWAGRLCARARQAGHALTYYNLGVRRETSRDIARRWQAECEPRLLPTSENYVVFSFGANDVSLVNGERRVKEGETVTHLEAMLQVATSRYRTLVIGAPPAADDEHNARLTALSARMQETATSFGVPYFDTLPHLINDRAWVEAARDNDGAHPRADGYARLATLIELWPAWWFTPR